MKKTIKHAVILTGLLFSFYSCEFTPSEIPMTEIEEPSAIAPPISIELRPEMDTLRLSDPVWITYSVETGDHKLYGINIQFDNAEIGNSFFESENKVRAIINTDLFEDGMHELKITNYASTNTGSIADKTGNEAYWYEIRWPVYINKHGKENFKLNVPEIVPEGIKVSWTEYRYADFDRYEFSLSSDNYQSGGIKITDPHQNFFIDSTCIEGYRRSYFVYVYYKENGLDYDYLIYGREILKPVIRINEDCSVDIRWTHSKKEEYVQSYCIRTSAPHYGTSEEHDLTDLNDTTVSLNEKIGFGGDYQAQLRYIPKGFNSYHSILNTAGGLTIFALGDSIPRFQKAFQITAENLYLIYKNGTFSKHNFITNETSESLSVTQAENDKIWTITGSPDGNYFGYFENQEYVVRQSSDLTIVNKLNIEAYNNYYFVLNDISISNDGLICASDYNNNLRIFDLTTGGKIFEKHFETNYFLRKGIISPDGKNIAVMLNDYNLATTSLVYFSFDGNQLNEVGRVHGVGEDYWSVVAYAPQAENKIIVSRWRKTYEYDVEVRDSRTFELLNSIALPIFFVPVAYDFTADRVIAQFQSFPAKKYSLLIDIKTGIQNKVVQFSGRESWVFTGGKVFAGNGRSIVIDDYILY